MKTGPIPFCLTALGIMTVAVFTASPCQVPAQQSQEPQSPTFTENVAPIIYTNCTVCHHSGGSAPFSLITYADVKSHGQQIKQVTGSRYMPPWLPEPGYGKFVDERRLSDEQIGTIGQWVTNGMPEGVRAKLPIVPTFSDDWKLGKPDLIVQMPQPYVLLAGGKTETWPRFVLPVPDIGTRYVRAVEIHPGNPKAVHHCYIVTDRSDVLHITNGQVYETGSTGMESRFAAAGSELDSRFLTWRPGTPPHFEPDGATWRLDKDTDLTLTLHLLGTGKSEVIQPSVGFYFSDKPPSQFPMIVRLEHDSGIDIPAGVDKYEVSDELELPVDVKVLSVLPHAHYLCREMQAYATLPDGTRRWLIWIKRWDFDWQGVFRYAEPVALPKGTVISMHYTYDNSEGNPRNPNTPPKRVGGGPQSTDEMADLWLEVLPESKQDLYPLEIALMQRKLAKYPSDLQGYADLGAALHAMGRNKEALAPLRDAARLQPDDVQVQNNLGTVFGSLGDLDEAIAHFSNALKLRPDYFAACLNLASALRLSGDLPKATEYYQEAVGLRPDSPEAHNKLGSIYAEQGNLHEAILQFQEVLRIQPNNAGARNELSRALQTLDGAPR
jgi:Flp pilus assembly protein TadD/mono/diheme cytochrome c family protein